MKPTLPLLTALLLAPLAVTGAEPIQIEATKSEPVNALYADGALPPLVGTHNIQILRATKDAPERAEERGFTYNHHVGDLYYHDNTFYVTWGSGEVAEHRLPYRTVVSSSADGFSWSKPAELQHHRHGADLEDWKNAVGSPPVAGALQDAYRRAVELVHSQSPTIAQVAKWQFAKDYGQGYFDSLYPDWRSNHPADHAIPLNVGDAFGKGASCFRRQDGQWVALSKWGWCSLSNDEGRTWSRPVIPATVKTGQQKISGYRAADDRYFLFFTPVRSSMVRWPLVGMQGRDGIVFQDMGVVHGEVPDMRYGGRWKSPGPQYNRVRIGEGPIRDAVWVVYSVSKEDIWISRVPLAAGTTVREPVRDDFDSVPVGALVPNWNIYRPQWAPVDVVALREAGNHALRLQDGDPFDYCRAVRVFPEARKTTCAFRVKPAQQDHGRLEIEIASRRGLRPVRLTFAEDGQLYATGHEWEYWLFGYKADQWVSVEVKIDLDQPTWQLAINGTITKEFQWANEPDRLMDGPVSAVERISFRTGKFRRLGKGIPAQMTFLPSGVDSYEGVARGSDRPITPAVYYLDDVRIDAGAAYGKTGKNAEKAGNTGL